MTHKEFMAKLNTKTDEEITRSISHGIALHEKAWAATKARRAARRTKMLMRAIQKGARL